MFLAKGMFMISFLDDTQISVIDDLHNRIRGLDFGKTRLIACYT
jgi:hypothetical protein